MGLTRKEELGMLLVFISAFCYSFNGVCLNLVLLADDHFSIWLTVLLRAFSLLLFTSIYLIYERDTTVFEHCKNKWFNLRGFFGGCSNLANYYALSHLPLGHAMAILATQPVIATLMAYFVLGEGFGGLQFIAMVMATGGAIMVAQPWSIGQGSATDQVTGLMSGVLAAISSGIVWVAFRKAKGIPASHLTWICGVYGTIFSLVAIGPKRLPELAKLWHDTNNDLWPNVIGVIVLSMIGLQLKTIGGKMTRAGLAAIARVTDVVWGFILGVLVLGNALEIVPLIGAVVILSGVLILKLSKASASGSKDPSSPEATKVAIKVVKRPGGGWFRQMTREPHGLFGGEDTSIAEDDSEEQQDGTRTTAYSTTADESTPLLCVEDNARHAAERPASYGSSHPLDRIKNSSNLSEAEFSPMKTAEVV